MVEWTVGHLNPLNEREERRLMIVIQKSGPTHRFIGATSMSVLQFTKLTIDHSEVCLLSSLGEELMIGSEAGGSVYKGE